MVLLAAEGLETPPIPSPGDEGSKGLGRIIVPSEGLRPWLGLTATGVAHFLKGNDVALVDNMACHSLSLAESFDAVSYFGHANTACSQFEQYDDPNLFNRLAGHEGLEQRSTRGAFAAGHFVDPDFQIWNGSKDVVLSPAVESVAPEAGTKLAPGKATTISVHFDARMDAKKANGVVTATGCGVQVSDAEWNGDSVLTATLKVPKEPPKGTITLTVDHAAAHAPEGNTRHELDGNTNPGATSGEAPNADDYTWTLTCSDVMTFKMAYTGTMSYDLSRTNPQTPPYTETADYKWSVTQVVTVTPVTDKVADFSTKITYTASGHATLDNGTTVHVVCNYQTPAGFGFAGTPHRSGWDGSPKAMVSFRWGLENPARLGDPGVTGAAGGAKSGCQTSATEFVEDFGIPEMVSTDIQHSVFTDAELQVFIDAETGQVTFPIGSLPQT
jgi:hypothetical protein